MDADFNYRPGADMNALPRTRPFLTQLGLLERALLGDQIHRLHKRSQILTKQRRGETIRARGRFETLRSSVQHAVFSDKSVHVSCAVWLRATVLRYDGPTASAVAPLHAGDNQLAAVRA